MGIAVGCSWFDELADHPEILDTLDFVEIPGWLLDDDFVRPHERLVLHNLEQDWSMASIDAIYPGWPDRLRDAIRITRTPWFSMHLGFASEEVRFEGHMLPVSKPLDRQELMARIVEVTNEARLSCPLQILLENLDYCPEGAYEHICDPEFIAEVLTMTRAGLLFDIAHWQVSASWLGYDPIDTLDLLPLEKTVEIHLSSPRPLPDGSGRLDDCHEALQPFDFEILRTVLERSRPRAVTFEYRRNREILAEQIAAVRKLLADPAGFNG